MLMNEVELNAKENGSPYAAHLAKLDALEISARNEALYSERQKREGRRVAKRLTDAYEFEKSYITFRKKWIAVKLQRPTAKRWILARDLDRGFKDMGYEKANSDQGFIVRIPRKVR